MSVIMYEYIDKYCERMLPGFWAEPLNLVSNLAYLIVGLLLIQMYQKSKLNQSIKNWDVLGLIVLILLIAIGSGLWHFFAQTWSLYADVVPILLFINLFIVSCLYRVAGCSFNSIAGIFLCYHFLNFGIQSTFEKDFLNGSIFYLPTWMMLVGISMFLRHRNLEMGSQFLNASIVFAVALFVRSIDLNLCNSFPVGTHFIWHLLSAYMMFLLVRVVILMSTDIKE